MTSRPKQRKYKRHRAADYLIFGSLIWGWMISILLFITFLGMWSHGGRVTIDATEFGEYYLEVFVVAPLGIIVGLFAVMFHLEKMMRS